MNIETLHFMVGTLSSIVCIVAGFALFAIRLSHQVDLQTPLRPLRYIRARRALGVAYLIIGVLAFVQLFTVDITTQEKIDSFPLIGLVISISQILLFTAAVLALLNSRLLNRYLITLNLLPLVLLLGLYVFFLQEEFVLFSIRCLLFFYYVIELVGSLIVFFIERRKYLHLIEDYFDCGKLYQKYRFKGITVLFVLAIVIGIWALASYFFTSLLQETIFIASYTVFYAIVAVYYISYSKHSQRILDVTTPENWGDTEDFSTSQWKTEKEQIQIH